MGIFKRFRASMTFGSGSMENVGSDEISNAVYRPFATDSIFSPGYRVIDEGSHNNPSNVTTRNSRPKAKKETKSARSKSTPNIQTSTSLGNGQVTVAPNNTVDDIQVRPGTSEGSSKAETKNKKDKESKNKKDKESKKEKEKDSKKEKAKEKKEKKEKQKVKVAVQSEDKGKAKKDKEKQKKDKEKTKKDKAKKGESTPVASVTIDELAVASTQGEVVKTNNGTLPPPPYTAQDEIVRSEPPKSRNVLANPLAVQRPNVKAENAPRSNVQTETAPTTNSGFASSWDQVAMHRQNLHRELQSRPQQNNLRSMMNKDKEVVGRAPTNRFTPNTNSPRNITSNSSTQNSRHKNNDSGSDGSGSEADA